MGMQVDGVRPAAGGQRRELVVEMDVEPRARLDCQHRRHIQSVQGFGRDLIRPDGDGGGLGLEPDGEGGAGAAADLQVPGPGTVVDGAGGVGRWIWALTIATRLSATA